MMTDDPRAAGAVERKIAIATANAIHLAEESLGRRLDTAEVRMLAASVARWALAPDAPSQALQ